jgi:RNA polymerase sigma-70 factor (ECF subfamily)
MELLDGDERLVAGCRSSDDRAWDEVYRRYADLVGRTITSICPHSTVDEVDELVQDTIVKLHEGLPSFRGDSSLKTYLVRIAQRVALDRRRRDRSIKRRAEERAESLEAAMEAGALTEPRSPDIGPESAAMRSQLTGAVMRALLESSFDGCRDAIVRYYFRGHSYERISEAHATSVSNVASRLKRCLLKLRRAILADFGPAAWAVVAEDF